MRSLAVRNSTNRNETAVKARAGDVTGIDQRRLRRRGVAATWLSKRKTAFDGMPSQRVNKSHHEVVRHNNLRKMFEQVRILLASTSKQGATR